MGKKVAIVAVVCTVICIIFSIVEIVLAPDIPTEVLKLTLEDQEAYEEKFHEIMENAPVMFNVANTVCSIASLVGIILSIISIVQLVKAKEKGKVIPILCIVTIIIFFLVTEFTASGGADAFMVGMEYGSNIAASMSAGQ